MVRFGKTKKFIALLGILIIANALVSFGMPENNANAKTKIVSIPLAQTFTGATKVDKKIKYVLSTTDTYEIGWLPDERQGGSYEFVVDGSVTYNIDLPIKNTGLFEYKLVQVDEGKEKYTYDDEEYTIRVLVRGFGDSDVESVIIRTDQEKTPSAAFDVYFKLSPTDPKEIMGPDGKKNPILADPPVRKTVKGKPSSTDEFYFMLKAEDVTNPMPEGSSNGEKYGIVYGEGEVEFGTWPYTKPGVYIYRILEMTGESNDYEYDSVVYSIEDRVEETPEGNLVQYRTITNGVDQVTDYAFENVYIGDDPDNGDAENNNDLKPDIITNALTGDDAKCLVLGVICILMIAIIRGILIRKKKR